jgi:hypothetical protein
MRNQACYDKLEDSILSYLFNHTTWTAKTSVNGSFQDDSLRFVTVVAWIMTQGKFCDTFIAVCQKVFDGLWIVPRTMEESFEVEDRDSMNI